MSDARDDQLAYHESSPTFDVVRKGYDRDQVAETLAGLDADLRVALADRDAAVSRSADLARQLQALHGEVEALRRRAASASAPTFENMGERISNMLQLAQDEAAEIRRSAQEQAAALQAAVAAEVDAVRERVAGEERALGERSAASQAEAERLVFEARQHAEQISAVAQARADDLVNKARERAAQLDADSQARRSKVEQDFEIAQRARRTEAARLEDEREQASIAAAQQRVADAEAHAARTVADADASAVEIRRIRDDVTRRLADVRSLLGRLPDLADQPQQAAEPAQVPPAEAAPAEAAAGSGAFALACSVSRLGLPRKDSSSRVAARDSRAASISCWICSGVRGTRSACQTTMRLRRSGGS